MNALKNLDLKSRIAIFTVVLFIGAIWLLVLDLDQEVGGNLEKVLAAQQFSTVEHIANSLDEAAKLRVRALADAASLIEPEWMSQSDKLHSFLAQQKPLYGFFDMGMMIISPKGIGLADLPNYQGREETNYSSRDYFQEVMTTGAAVIGKPVMDELVKKPVIFIGVPIRNAANEVIGVLVGADRISGGDFLGAILPKEVRTGGDFHVFSPKDGLIVTSTNRDLTLQAAPTPGTVEMYDRLKRGYEGSGISKNTEGIDSLISGKQVPSTNWLVIATLPTSVAFEAIATLHRDIYKDAALASVIIALLLWAFLYRQLTPLSRSAVILDAMTQGRIPLAPLPIKGGREIRRLLNSFNELQRNIFEQRASLLKNAEQLQLAASVFDGASEAILISAADNSIIAVNQAFCRMTGYEESELIGQNPRLLQSGKHEPDFYQAMWTSLWNTGEWQGEIWNRRKNGEIFPQRLAISTLYDNEQQVLRRIAIAADITQQKRAEELIWQQANFDLLTKLPNRRLLRDRLQQEVKKAQRSKRSMGLLFVDLDRFKRVNDTLGHAVGDQVLIEAAERISNCVRASDTVAHQGGDEFAIVFSCIDNASHLERQSKKILDVLAEPFLIGQETVYVTASIGITLFPADSEDIDELLKNADQALSAAKEQGSNHFCYFTDSMQKAAHLRMLLANDLREALAAKQFEVHYQPIVDLNSGRVVKAEALLRWHHPERGMVGPADFIPIAEETGLIVDIGDWVFKEAAQMAKRWCGYCEFMANGVCGKPKGMPSDMACRFQIGINKSPRQFIVGNTGETWIDYLRELDVSPHCVSIEITEGLLLDQHPEVSHKLLQFRDAGIQVALDDFGTGYSAMSYLKKFDIDYIKIDRSFVRDIASDPSDLAIAEAVIAMAHKLGMKVVAEGVETAAQLDLLVAAGCDYGQGYLFARPMPAEQFEGFIALSPSFDDAGLRQSQQPLINIEVMNKESINV